MSFIRDSQCIDRIMYYIANVKETLLRKDGQVLFNLYLRWWNGSDPVVDPDFSNWRRPPASVDRENTNEYQLICIGDLVQIY